jgi:capsular exopolysaccharide synthesis family protein
VPQEEKTLELRDYLRVLRRHKWLMAITVVVCLSVALGVSLSKAPVYATTTQVILERRLVDRLFVPTEQQSDESSNRKRANEIQVMSSPEVRAKVQELLGREPEQVTFTALTGTDVVLVGVRGSDPRKIAKTANAFAETYIAFRTEQTVNELNQAGEQIQARIAEVDTRIATLDQSLIAAPPPPAVFVNGRNVTPTDPREAERAQLVSQRDSFARSFDQMRVGVSVAQQTGARILSEARVPADPVNQDPVRNVGAGLALGIVLAIALAFLREYLDDSVKTKEDLEAATGLTVVGIVPVISDWKKRDNTPLISMAQPRSPAAEAYRSVRTSVEFLSLDQPMGTVQVTSALASEGKTSTLANLAVTFARAGQRVIVLCCDLRRPRVHEFFGLSNRVGFTSVLLGDTPLAQAIQPADPELPIGLVASGPLPPNPAELLASKRAVDVIEDLDRRCDLLLIDSPPVLPVTDALVISGLVDGVLLVANAGSSTRRGTKRAAELLRQVEAPLIGSILNGVGSKLDYGFSYGGDNRYYLDAQAPAKRTGNESRNGKAGGRRRPARAVR